MHKATALPDRSTCVLRIALPAILVLTHRYTARRDYGGVSRFSGRVETVKCFENNPLVRQRLTSEDGTGKVLVVDGGGSTRRALMGDMLGAGAVKMGWRVRACGLAFVVRTCYCVHGKRARGRVVKREKTLSVVGKGGRAPICSAHLHTHLCSAQNAL